MLGVEVKPGVPGAAEGARTVGGGWGVVGADACHDHAEGGREEDRVDVVVCGGPGGFGGGADGGDGGVYGGVAVVGELDEALGRDEAQLELSDDAEGTGRATGAVEEVDVFGW